MNMLKNSFLYPLMIGFTVVGIELLILGLVFNLLHWVILTVVILFVILQVILGFNYLDKKVNQPLEKILELLSSLYQVDNAKNKTGFEVTLQIHNKLFNDFIISNAKKDDLINRLASGELWNMSESDMANPYLSGVSKILQNMDQLSSEIEFVTSEINKNGNLKARIDNKKNLSGRWSSIGSSINDLIDSISTPLLKISSVLKKMANGDLTQRLELDTSGDIRESIDNMNQALDNLDGLLSTISKKVSIIDESSIDIKHTSQEMFGTTQEISSAISEMSRGAQNQVAKVDESSKLIEEMMISSNETTRKSELIHSAAKKGSEVSQNGVKTMQGVVKNMEDISSYSLKTNLAMESLSDSAREISQVLGVITEIASQTNLLALNAAIEAAQAGEAGRGFAVVADEIRKLAESSKESVSKIGGIVRAVQAEANSAFIIISDMKEIINEGVDITKAAEKSYNSIYESSSQTLSLSEEVMQSMKRQVEDIESIVNGTESIAVVAEQTAAGTEEVATSSAEFSKAMENYSIKADSLAKVAEEFREGISMVKLSGDNKESVLFKLREKFEHEKMLLDALLNNAPDFIYFKDRESKFIRNSMAHIKRFGKTKQEEITGLSDFDFQGEHAREAYEDEQKIIETGVPMVNVVQRADIQKGVPRYLSTTKMPLKNTEGNTIGTFGISRNITELKLAEIRADELERKIAELKRT